MSIRHHPAIMIKSTFPSRGLGRKGFWEPHPALPFERECLKTSKMILPQSHEGTKITIIKLFSFVTWWLCGKNGSIKALSFKGEGRVGFPPSLVLLFHQRQIIFYSSVPDFFSSFNPSQTLTIERECLTTSIFTTKPPSHKGKNFYNSDLSAFVTLW